MSAAARSGGVLAVGALGAYAAWLLAHPVSLGSDDALFFVRGVERFSVLELAPHFPGYPAFVLAAQGVALATGDAARALFVVSVLAGVAVPPLIYAFVRGAGGTRALALAAAACALAQPLLASLSLSLLSDSLGLALILGYLVALQRGAAAGCGALLALALAARPSYAVLGAAAALCFALQRRAVLARFAAGFAVVAAGFALYVLSRDASGYLAEGWRFARGHFEIWGHGAPGADADGWPATLAGAFGGAPGAAAVALALLAGARSLDLRSPACAAALAMIASYGPWLVLAQNPEQARHVAPVVFLGIALAGAGLARAEPRRSAAAALGLALCGALAARGLALRPQAAPLERASLALAAHPGALVVTQRGVEVLRAQRPELRILDAYYADSARFAARSEHGGEVLRLSAAPLAAPWRELASFAGRFAPEPGLRLYRLEPVRSARLAD